MGLTRATASIPTGASNTIRDSRIAEDRALTRRGEERRGEERREERWRDGRDRYGDERGRGGDDRFGERRRDDDRELSYGASRAGAKSAGWMTISAIERGWTSAGADAATGRTKIGCNRRFVHRSRGSSASRRPSPSRLNETTVTKIASPGQIAIHGALTRKRWAALSMLPHDGAGGCWPSPRKEGGLGDDGGGDGERGLHDQRRQDVGQDMTSAMRHAGLPTARAAST